MILHTLPTRKGKEPATEEQVEEPGAVTDLGPAVVPAGKDGKQGRLHTSMSTIPRLVSVVEIIKREYVKKLDPALAEKGCLAGLHQYNEVGALEDLSDEQDKEQTEEDRRAAIIHALQSKNQCVYVLLASLV